MVAAVRVHKPGGPEVLTYEDVQIAAPGQGQIKIKQHACWRKFHRCVFPHGDVSVACRNAFYCRQ